MKPFEVIDAQPQAWSIISRSFAANRIASTYLFTGTYGAGHFAFAQAVAALLNCTSVDPEAAEGSDIRPCGVCRNCRAILGLNFEGLQVVVPIPPHRSMSEAVDQTNVVLDQMREEPLVVPSGKLGVTLPIDMAREVKQSLTRRSSEDITRVAVFDRMETMRTSSADALLKLIEEPPPQTVIILTAERPDSLLPTLRSRSQLVRLRRAPEQFIVDYVNTRFDIDKESATLVARLSEGLPGRALELARGLDDGDDSMRSIGWLLFKSLLGSASPDAVAQVLDMVDPRDRAQAEQLLTVWQSFVRDCANYAVTGSSDSLTNVDFKADIICLSEHFNAPDVADMMAGEIKNTLAELRYNVHIHSALIALVLKIRRQLASLRADSASTPA